MPTQTHSPIQKIWNPVVKIFKINGPSPPTVESKIKYLHIQTPFWKKPIFKGATKWMETQSFNLVWGQHLLATWFNLDEDICEFITLAFTTRHHLNWQCVFCLHIQCTEVFFNVLKHEAYIFFIIYNKYLCNVFVQTILFNLHMVLNMFTPSTRPNVNTNITHPYSFCWLYNLYVLRNPVMVSYVARSANM